VRLIGGEFGGRKIALPKNIKSRPTTDMAREGLFNILHHRFTFSGIRVLDLFSGTGSISFEFYSRGCRAITAIENDRFLFRQIKKIRDELGFTSINILNADAYKTLQKDPGTGYDIIFADPPYNHPDLPTLPSLILGGRWLNPEGLFILEHPKENSFKEEKGFMEERKYGMVHFSFFRSVYQ